MNTCSSYFNAAWAIQKDRENLEKYGNDEFFGYEDIVEGLKKASKKKKRMISLKEYNEKNEKALLKILK